MIDIDTYFSKVPHRVEEVLPGPSKVITCLSYYSYYLAQKSAVSYADFDYIAIDGSLVQKLYNLIHRVKTPRISVDMTSLVPLIFDHVIARHQSVYFLGARQDEIDGFVRVISSAYPALAIAGYRNGYFDSPRERRDVLAGIVTLNPGVVFIGTGTPLQDEMALELKNMGYAGTVYTCGGFIHQTRNALNYYPLIVNKLNLRVVYRLFHEKGILKKMFPSLFVFLRHYLVYAFRRK